MKNKKMFAEKFALAKCYFSVAILSLILNFILCCKTGKKNCHGLPITRGYWKIILWADASDFKFWGGEWGMVVSPSLTL